MKRVLMFLGIILGLQLLSLPGQAADVRASDNKWFQFNLMKSIDNKIPFGNQQDTYFEMEFGGRSGALDLYGFLDVFDILDTPDSDRHNGDNFFLKLSPRFSLNALTETDLAVGPIQEWYIATLFNIGDRSLQEHFFGFGTDVEIPWLGKTAFNLMARFVRENYGAANERRWDGYNLTSNWFKPFYFFGNNSFLSYQGYVEYKFAAVAIADGKDRSDSSLEWFNGLYWHSSRYAAGYGLKLYQDMALFKDGGFGGNTSGLGHYLALIYKF